MNAVSPLLKADITLGTKQADMQSLNILQYALVSTTLITASSGFREREFLRQISNAWERTTITADMTVAVLMTSRW